MNPKSNLWVISVMIAGVLGAPQAFAADAPWLAHAIDEKEEIRSLKQPASPPIKVSGHLQTLNYATRSTGLKPETADNPYDRAKQDSDLFDSESRARIRIEVALDAMDKKIEEFERKIRGRLAETGEKPSKFTAVIEYDHVVNAGSYVGRGDFRIRESILHRSQAVDLSNSIVEDSGILYEETLHRGYLSYKSDEFNMIFGRQQIPWGVGRFKTPTDVFNPFTFTQLEWDERQGVDALNTSVKLGLMNANYVFTPRGRLLHPERHMVRLTQDLGGYETSFIGGKNGDNAAFGYDLQGNLGSASVRSELLYEDPREASDYVRMVFNIDYNFPNKIYTLLEYYYNGRGGSDPHSYDLRDYIRGEIQDLGKQYLGWQVGYDITPLLRIDNYFFANLNDTSAVDRIELKNSLNDNTMLTLAAILTMGNANSEYGSMKDLYFAELEWSF